MFWVVGEVMLVRGGGFSEQTFGAKGTQGNGKEMWVLVKEVRGRQFGL